MTTGASLTAATSIVSACGAVGGLTPSLSVTSKLALPLSSAAGTKLNAPFAAIAGAVANETLGAPVGVSVYVSVWPASSAPPLLAVAKPASEVFASSFTETAADVRTKLGASSSAETSIVNVRSSEVSSPLFAVPPSSVTLIVTCAVPLVFVALV